MAREGDPIAITRRDFVQAGLAAGAATLLGPGALTAASPRPRYALVGTGVRSFMYVLALLQSHADDGELVALCDRNVGRMKAIEGAAVTSQGAEVATYASGDFDRMIRETRPDVVIVTTMDSTHDEYIVRALDLGCDVITEKPMTTDAPRCQRILDALARTGGRCRVTFNYRYSPPRTQVKELLMGGEIGEVLSVDFQWMLNTHHGADYFRRWHSRKEFSGGLLVHKSTHHFDLVNWWLSAVPETVTATGKREFYTPAMARRMGLESHHERCLSCPEKAACGFHFDIGQGYLKLLYLDNEKYDGYFRDRCVFRPEIDIEDSLNVLVRYDDGVLMDYSLNAFNAWEGYRVVFNGTRGRIEHEVREQVYVSGTGTEQGGIAEGGVTTTVFPLRGPGREIEIWAGEGSHGGGDARLLDDLFRLERPADKYLRAADHRAGAWSILTGVAANRSIVTGETIRVAELVQGLERPDYPPMPPRTGPVPMPPRIDLG